MPTFYNARSTLTICLISGLALACLAASKVATAANTGGHDELSRIAELYGEQTRWGIHRKNKRIGTHTVSFASRGDALIVDIESAITVTMLRVPVYRFRYEAREIWEDGRLTEASATVTENGDITRTLMSRTDNETLMRGPDGDSVATDVQYATNHWHPGVLEVPTIFNTIKGETNEVQVSQNGRGQLALTDGSAIDFTRYHYSGDLELESWYDDTGRWVGMNFPGEDGSRVEYRLEQAPSAKLN